MPRQQDQQIRSTSLLPRIGRTVFRVADGRPWVIRKLTKTKIQLSEPDSGQIEFTVSHDEFARWFNASSQHPTLERAILEARNKPLS